MSEPSSIEDIPVHPRNWPAHPQTVEEFQIWMKETEEALRTWLRLTRSQVQEEQTVVQAVWDFNAEAATAWADHEPNTDLQTGTIGNRKMNQDMEKVMQKLGDNGKKMHHEHKTWWRHLLRRYADMAWEDFLYYQNVWHRKNFKPDQVFFETKSERDFIEATTNQGGMQTRANTAGVGTTLNDRNGLQNEPIKRPCHQPTELIVPYEVGTGYWPLHELHEQWLDYLISLYMKFRLAYRKEAPAEVNPEDAHRYSQPSRVTAKPARELHLARHEHSEMRFPRSKRKRTTDTDGHDANSIDEVEEIYPSQDTIELYRRYKRDGQMEDIVWHLNREEVERCKARKTQEAIDRFEAHEGYWQDKADVEYARNTKNLIPADQAVYHGSLATSFDWPTSFDNTNGANNIARTLSRKEYIYESDSGESGSNGVSEARRRDAKRKLRKVEPKTRYKQSLMPVPGKFVKTVELAYNADGTVKGRDASGRWIGKNTRKPAESLAFDMVSRKRVALSPRFMFKRRFQVRLEANEDAQNSRQSLHERNDKMDELSDTEDGDRGTNKNYRWSGNENPNQLPRGDGGTGSGSDPDGEDDESDDEGDLFRQSYEECSGTECPKRRARRLHANLVAVFGALPPWSEQRTLDMVRKGRTDEYIRAAYKETSDMLKRARDEGKESPEQHAQWLHTSLVAEFGAIPSWPARKTLDMVRRKRTNGYIRAAYKETSEMFERARNEAV